MDTLGNRGTLLNSVNRILSLAQREQRLRETGQSTMFDLFGEAAAVPLPELDMPPSETTDREKAVWEKELMGVSFSEKPFSPVFSGEIGNAVFCGNIDAELEKQVVAIAGRVVSARYSFTKKGETFSIAILEDVSGQVEVIAWPNVYSQTEEYWQEGNELVVLGKVRARDDSVNVVCDSVSYYEAPREGEKPPPEPVAVESAPEKPASISPPTERHRLIINIKQTQDANGDITRFNRIMDVLKSYPGRDEVRLNIVNGGDAIPLKLPNVQTVYSLELEERITELVGEENCRVETIR
jgi:DNA polymerase-3 subunit alpha